MIVTERPNAIAIQVTKHKTPLQAKKQSNSSDVCMQCGACCASFRVSFYWAEEAKGIPQQMVLPLSAVYSCMQGTNQKQPRCVALQGQVGQQVRCGIYAARPSACHEVKAGDAQCNKARAKHGIPVLNL